MIVDLRRKPLRLVRFPPPTAGRASAADQPAQAHQYAGGAHQPSRSDDRHTRDGGAPIRSHASVITACSDFACQPHPLRLESLRDFVPVHPRHLIGGKALLTYFAR